MPVSRHRRPSGSEKTCVETRCTGYTQAVRPTLAAAWQALAILLENHATTKERDVENI